MEQYLSLIVAVITGLATAIPLVIKLVEYCKKSVQEKNWNQLLKLVQNLMTTAETKFDNGGDRKEWVLMMIKASANTINYEINLDEISELIDSLVDMTNAININKEIKEVEG